MATKVLNYFYRPVKNLDLNRIEFCDVYQILSDGTNVSSLYGFLEDKSSFMALCEAAFLKASQYRTSLYETEFIDSFKLCFSPTTEYLKNSDNFKRLVKYLDSVNLRTKDTVMFFDVSDIYGAHKDAFIKNLKHLKSYGLQICVGGFGDDINLIEVFAEPFFDYFRVSAKYVSNIANLSLLTEACSKNGVKFIVEGVDKISDFRAVRAGKVSLVSGDAVCKSVETVDRKTLGLKPLTSAEADRFAYRLSQEKITKEQNLLLKDGKKLLKRARHDFNFDTGEFIVASSRQNVPVVERRANSAENETVKLLKEGKLPKPKEVKLDESGNEMMEEYNNSIIESLYALVADKSVKDKETAVKQEILRREALKAEEEKKAKAEAELNARLERALAEKKRILPHLLYALESRIDYLIDLDRIRIELDAIVEQEIIELLEQERKESETLARQKEEAERDRLAAEAYAKIQADELNKKQAEEIARLKAELLKAEKLKADRAPLQTVAAQPTKIKKPIELGEFVPATIEEEVPAFIEDDFYIASIDDSEFLKSEIYTPKKKLSKKEKKAEEKRREIEKTLVYDLPVQKAVYNSGGSAGIAQTAYGKSPAVRTEAPTETEISDNPLTAQGEQALLGEPFDRAWGECAENTMTDNKEAEMTEESDSEKLNGNAESATDNEAMGTESESAEEDGEPFNLKNEAVTLEREESEITADSEKDKHPAQSTETEDSDTALENAPVSESEENAQCETEKTEGNLYNPEQESGQTAETATDEVPHKNLDLEPAENIMLSERRNDTGEKFEVETVGEAVYDTQAHQGESTQPDIVDGGNKAETQTEDENVADGDSLALTDGEEEGVLPPNETLAFTETESGGEEANEREEDDQKAQQKKRVFDGGFDIDKEYDDNDGHYNADFKWIDSDGEEYNGYFAKNGNWIDYGYFDSGDEWHDNGYRDENGMWIPDGYFNDDGDFVKI